MRGEALDVRAGIKAGGTTNGERPERNDHEKSQPDTT